MLHGPVNGILALTTHEKVMFFDMDRRVFLDERSIGKCDVKAYDPGRENLQGKTGRRVRDSVNSGLF